MLDVIVYPFGTQRKYQSGISLAEIDPDEIGARLRQIRGTATQSEFAALLGVGRVSIVRYETGERTPDVELVVKLFDELRVDPIWLLTGRGEPPKLKSTPQEALLLKHYRSGGSEARKAIDAMAAAFATGATPPTSGSAIHRNVSQVFHDKVGRVVSGDVTIHHPRPSTKRPKT